MKLKGGEGGQLEGWGSAADPPFQKTIPSPERHFNTGAVPIGGGAGVGVERMHGQRAHARLRRLLRASSSLWPLRLDQPPSVHAPDGRLAAEGFVEQAFVGGGEDRLLAA